MLQYQKPFMQISILISVKLCDPLHKNNLKQLNNFQVNNPSETEIQYMADHLGHTKSVNREFYK